MAGGVHGIEAAMGKASGGSRTDGTSREQGHALPILRAAPQPIPGITVKAGRGDRAVDKGGTSCDQEKSLILLAILEFVTPAVLACTGGDPEDRAAEVLERMRQDRLTERVSLTEGSPWGDGGLYFLTERGAKVASQLTKETVWRPPAEQRTSFLLPHHVAVSQAVVGLMASLGPHRLQAVYLGRRLGRLLRTSSLRGWYFPDAYLAFPIDATREGVQRHLFLEVDRGTESRAQLIRKFRALNTYYLHDHRSLFRTDRLVVAVTAPTTRRLTGLCEAAREAKCRVRILANLHSEVRLAERALEGWTDCLTGETRSLLDGSHAREDGGST